MAENNRGVPLSQDLQDKIVHLYLVERYNYTKIGKELNIDRNTVSKYVKENNLIQKREELIENIKQSLIKAAEDNHIKTHHRFSNVTEKLMEHYGKEIDKHIAEGTLTEFMSKHGRSLKDVADMHVKTIALATEIKKVQLEVNKSNNLDTKTIVVFGDGSEKPELIDEDWFDAGTIIHQIEESTNNKQTTSKESIDAKPEMLDYDCSEDTD